MIEYLRTLLPHESKVLILGFGREGKSTFDFLSRYFPEIQLGIADKNEQLFEDGLSGIRLHLGEHYLDAIGQYDFIIKSPGVRLPKTDDHLLAKLTSQTDLFLKIYGRQTIGVTGTKGKSTTVSLINHLLKQSGRDVLLMGNIGLPAFDFIEKIKTKTLVVYELSAHQLQYVHHAPHIAVLLNLYPEHLDFFENFDAYRKAKENIFAFQQPKDVAICGHDVQNRFCDANPNDLTQAMESIFGKDITGEKLLQLSGLKGEHNLQNILLSTKAAMAAGLSEDEIISGLQGFQSLPHRLEEAGTYGGIRFINDSIATIPQATLAAVKSMGAIDALILGGFDRGIDFSDLIEFLSRSKVRYFFFLGKAGKRMMSLLKEKSTSQMLIPVNNLEEIFGYLQSTDDIHSCLLSPAAASYDQFHNFEHRGDRFKALASQFQKDS